MLMKVSQNLDRQEIWAEGNELVSVLGRDRDEHGKRVWQRPYSEKELVAEIIDPVLLTDIYAISKMEPTKRDTVFSLYGCYPRTVEYDGVAVWWDPGKHLNVWGPSIDTLVFANAMRTGNVLTDNVKSTVDVGCASGFLGKYAMEKCPSIKELTLVDLNPCAIECAGDNVRKIDVNKWVRYCLQDGRELKGLDFDLVMCNPPYVPRPDSIDDNPYEGVGLLHDMIVNGKEYLGGNGKLIITTSSLCSKITENAVEEAKGKGLASIRTIGRKRVPFKVNPVLNNGEWVSYLRGMGLRKTPERGYEYWHEISVMEIMYE